jgi:hypothetical protein
MKIMKKNRTIYLSIFSIIFINLIFLSCTNEENIEPIQKKEPELFKGFNLIDGSNIDYAKKDVGVEVTLSIGRKSKKCRKIGICKVEKSKNYY